MHAETHTHTHVGLGRSELISTETKKNLADQFKFKENFRCKHLQTFSLSLCFRPPLSTTLPLPLSVCIMLDAFIPDSWLYYEYVM